MSSRADRADELRKVFESVTGTDRVVEAQDEEAAGSADGDASNALTELRIDAVRNDVLSDVSSDSASSV
ncbi:hypothetical protein Hbl1158_09105 [Halobaculum sp. CBA1158]|uniref:hypothetical protein n=1 Tax=Halobaculum sp. CBA1158 TaxID=2904243 RepID=UPI001F267029|nr:hypothetical protein [Halobaculum sp. CBA1158]UIO98707.1 hypothetical protein Hbl1158_09105 [Halobaculum sp. CBA1158]